MITSLRTNSDNPDFQKLVVALDAYLRILDGDDHLFYAQLNKTDSIKHVIVVYQNGESIGCGAIRHYSGNTVEVKRMYVLENQRGKGIASTILNELENWAKGTAVTLTKWDGYRDAANVKLKKVTFRFINDSSAQVAALLAGDIDGMPRFQSPQSLKQFQSDKRFAVEMGSTAGKGIMTINNKKKPFDDVRVRRALSHAIDKKAFIDGVFEGLAKPIGSHMAPTDAGYVDLTGQYAFDPEKAKALLKEAGVQTPLNVTLTLPPPPYARKGGEILAAQLAKVGIVAKIENVEWAQWLGGTFKGNFDLTVINHVEPLDYMAYANPNYYWGYDSKAFRDLAAKHSATTGAKDRTKLFGDMQRMIANDSVNVFLFNATNTAVYKKGLKGLWSSSPIFANDMASVSWN